MQPGRSPRKTHSGQSCPEAGGAATVTAGDLYAWRRADGNEMPLPGSGLGTRPLQAPGPVSGAWVPPAPQGGMN